LRELPVLVLSQWDCGPSGKHSCLRRLLILSQESRYRIISIMIGRFARFAARIFFREIVLVGKQNLPEAAGSVIFTPNHPNSLIDPLLLFFLSPPFRLRFVAKAPLFKIPVFGSILRSIGAIPVVRKFEAGGEVDYSAFFASCVDALAQGHSIVIFPEGRSLPQSYLAPLKTGPARLFLMAKEKGIRVSMIPVGLNYEKGTTFRSDVLVSIAPAIQTGRLIGIEPSLAIRQLTEALTQSLEEHIVQTESFRERELMMLLEKISAEQESDQSDFERFGRLKEFERGLSRLRISAAGEIDQLRKLLSRYEKLSNEYRINLNGNFESLQWNRFPAAILGAILAIPGWILNFLPYHLCDLLIKTRDNDASVTATYKVVFSLFLFPIFYFLEGYLLYRFFGTSVAILFFVFILPLSYFTLIYGEWFEFHFSGMLWAGSRLRRKAQLERLRGRILNYLERLRTM
jgi:glycerol-3-phosphate O-acyltransferase / dihydroxyacetone phosphate acyltransferase